MGATTSRHRHFPPDGRLIGLALAIIATLYLTISTLTLLNWGFNYDEVRRQRFREDPSRDVRRGGDAASCRARCKAIR